MPFYDASNSEKCLAETQDALSMIDLLIENHPFHLIIIGGDLNTELKGESPFDTLWTEMMTRNALASCSPLFSSPGYTYHHETLGHKKLIDHFVLSHTLLNNMTSGHRILDDGSNLSDHLPIMLQLNVSVSRTAAKPNSTSEEAKLRWKKQCPSDTSAYTERLSVTVDEMITCRGDQTKLICTSNCHCSDESCRYYIQQEYDDLISCLKIADTDLPRHKPGCRKDWWTQELSDLKRQSEDIHKLWKVEGKPRSGLTYSERLRVRSRYKRSIREAQRATRQDAWNKIHTSMEKDDTNGFWNSWRSLYNKNKSHFAPVVDGCSSKESIAESFRRSFQENSKPNNSDNLLEKEEKRHHE